MTRKEVYNLFEEMMELLGERTLLYDLFDALETDEMEDNLIYIADSNGLNYLYED